MELSFVRGANNLFGYLLKRTVRRGNAQCAAIRLRPLFPAFPPFVYYNPREVSLSISDSSARRSRRGVAVVCDGFIGKRAPQCKGLTPFHRFRTQGGRLITLSLVSPRRELRRRASDSFCAQALYSLSFIIFFFTYIYIYVDLSRCTCVACVTVPCAVRVSFFSVRDKRRISTKVEGKRSTVSGNILRG